MGEIFFTILVFFGVIVITAVVFGGWVVVSLVKLIIRGIHMMLEPQRTVSTMPPPPPGHVRCRQERCCADNPKDARFCRRCGHMMPDVEQVHARRRAAAAVW